MSDHRVNLAESIAKLWNREGINYAIMHGLERYPHSLGRDLDILMEKGHTDRALVLAAEAIEKEGWPIVIMPPPLHGKRIVAFAEDYELNLEIHTMEGLRWFTVSFVDKPEPQYQVGPFKVDPWASIIKRILLPLLGEGVKRFHDKPHELQVNERERILLRRLTKYLGRTNTLRVAQLLETCSAEELRAFIPKLRRTLFLRSLLHPVRAFANGVRFLKLHAGQYASPCGPVVAVVGPDGIGKSSALSALKAQLPLPFTGARLRHWRPGLLPPLRTLVGRPPATGSAAPRRNPGSFHWLRLVYYFFDFLFGYWLKDVPESSQQQIVLYDRCALDMSVDPVRFGLGSTRGTRLLWKLTPKPDLVILLWDTPQRIAQRKQELGKEEIERQLSSWATLVEQGHVSAVVPIDAGPEIIAKRISELALRAFIRKNGGNRSLDDVDAMQYMKRILVKDSAQTTGRVGTDSLAENGQPIVSGLKPLNGKYRKSSVFAICPNARSARLLIPLISPPVAATSLRVYNAMKPFARARKALLAAGLRSGVAQPVLRHRFHISAHEDMQADKLAGVLLEEHLKKALGLKDLAIAVSLGTPGVDRKPLIQVMSPHGRIKAYVKVGWNPQTIQLVKNEEAMLRRLENESFSTAVIPRILEAGWWNDHYLLVEEPSHGEIKRPSQKITNEHLVFLRELHNLEYDRSRLAESQFWQALHEIVDLLAAKGFTYYQSLIRRALTTVQNTVGSMELPFGFRHGDFTPWNTMSADDELLVFDWEYAQGHSPPAWDLFHFLIQTAVLVDGKSPREAYAILAGRSAVLPITQSYLKQLDLPPELFEPLLVLYLSDVLARYLSYNSKKVDEKDETLAQAWSYILHRLAVEKELVAWRGD